MATARDYCINALYGAGIVGEGDDCDQDRIKKALREFNRMFARWNAENLMRYAKVTSVYSSSSASITIGATGNIVSDPRPNTINKIKLANDVVLVQVSESDFAELPTQGGQPSRFKYSQTMPNGTITFWPEPSGTQTYTVTYDLQYGDYGLNDTVTIPPAMEDLAQWTMADRVAKAFGFPRADLEVEAEKALRIVKYNNVTFNEMKLSSTMRNQQNGTYYENFT